MQAKNALDVRCRGKSGVRGSLLNFDTIIIVKESEILKGRFSLLGKLKGRADEGEYVFRSVFTVAGEGKVVNLTKKQDKMTLIHGAVDGFIVTGGGEAKG